MATIITVKKSKAPKKTSEERKAALDLRTMNKRGTITLCIHGINEKYCKTCLEKAALKSTKKAQSAKKKTANSSAATSSEISLNAPSMT